MHVLLATYPDIPSDLLMTQINIRRLIFTHQLNIHGILIINELIFERPIRWSGIRTKKEPDCPTEARSCAVNRCMERIILIKQYLGYEAELAVWAVWLMRPHSAERDSSNIYAYKHTHTHTHTGLHTETGPLILNLNWQDLIYSHLYLTVSNPNPSHNRTIQQTAWWKPPQSLGGRHERFKFKKNELSTFFIFRKFHKKMCPFRDLSSRIAPLVTPRSSYQLWLNMDVKLSEALKIHESVQYWVPGLFFLIVWLSNVIVSNSNKTFI